LEPHLWIFVHRQSSLVLLLQTLVKLVEEGQSDPRKRQFDYPVLNATDSVKASEETKMKLLKLNRTELFGNWKNCWEPSCIGKQPS